MGQSLDPRADIYSMGVVLYEALTGRLPLVGKNMVETMSKHMNEKPPSFKEVRPVLFIPERVEQVVMRALAKEPHERPQTMAELAQDLRFSIPKPGQTPSLRAIELIAPSSDETRPAPPWVVPAVIGAFLVLLGAIAWFSTSGHQSVSPPPVVPAAPLAKAPLPAVAPSQSAPAPQSLLPATPAPAPPAVPVAHVPTPIPPSAPHKTKSAPAHSARPASGDSDPFNDLMKLKSHQGSE
jgi:serine/threonine-protein kinase